MREPNYRDNDTATYGRHMHVNARPGMNERKRKRSGNAAYALNRASGSCGLKDLYLSSQRSPWAEEPDTEVSK